MARVTRRISSYFRPQMSMLCCFNSSKTLEIQTEPCSFFFKPKVVNSIAKLVYVFLNFEHCTEIGCHMLWNTFTL